MEELYEKFKNTYNMYSKLHEELSEKIELAGIDESLLTDLINLREELTKIKVIIKIDDLVKI